jgi:hypothetical protein
MGVSRDDMGFAGAQFWKRSTKQGQRRSNTMRIGLKYITPALAAVGAAAVAIAAAPAATADPAPAQPATIATAAAFTAVAGAVTAAAGSDRGWGNWFGWRR